MNFQILYANAQSRKISPQWHFQKDRTHPHPKTRSCHIAVIAKPAMHLPHCINHCDVLAHCSRARLAVMNPPAASLLYYHSSRARLYNVTRCGCVRDRAHALCHRFANKTCAEALRCAQNRTSMSRPWVHQMTFPFSYRGRRMKSKILLGTDIRIRRTVHRGFWSI